MRTLTLVFGSQLELWRFSHRATAVSPTLREECETNLLRRREFPVRPRPGPVSPVRPQVILTGQALAPSPPISGSSMNARTAKLDADPPIFRQQIAHFHVITGPWTGKA